MDSPLPGGRRPAKGGVHGVVLCRLRYQQLHCAHVFQAQEEAAGEEQTEEEAAKDEL